MWKVWLKSVKSLAAFLSVSYNYLEPAFDTPESCNQPHDVAEFRDLQNCWSQIFSAYYTVKKHKKNNVFNPSFVEFGNATFAKVAFIGRYRDP
jgi:hypothetical protein